MNSIPHSSENELVDEYLSFISSTQFPCVAARSAYTNKQIRCHVGGNMLCPANDRAILDFIYQFVDEYRNAQKLYHSAAVIFTGPEVDTDQFFEQMLWRKLQSLSDLDAAVYDYDDRVCSDPSSPHFSFSLKKEAFFVIALHPASSRVSRRFKYPTLAFNPHDQFEILRQQHHYDRMKQTVRYLDMKLSGSVNPMLDDFGSSSEALQYSGRQYDNNWKCPLNITHGNAKKDPTP